MLCLLVFLMGKEFLIRAVADTVQAMEEVMEVTEVTEEAIPNFWMLVLH